MNNTVGSISTSEAIPDFLQTLGLSPPVSVEDVKQAYRIKVESVQVSGAVADLNVLRQAFERRWSTPSSAPDGWSGSGRMSNCMCGNRR